MNSSNYVYGSKLSYLDYLQGQLYVEDIKKQNRSLIMDMSRQTRQLIASNEALAGRDIQIRGLDAEMIKDYLDAAAERQIDMQEQLIAGVESGFERLTYSISDLSAIVANGMNAVGAKFQWCCSKIITSIGGMNDTLKELVKIAKTPTLTAAMEHFDIARNANRQGLYSDALEELNYAINGVPGVSAGYKLEWRFYQMTGVIKLGFIDCDITLVNLAEAEQAFLSAAKYAGCDYPVDAANAYLSAGWAAYCQGKLPTAASYTEAALENNPALAEAWYQLAKVNMALDNLDGIKYLKEALKLDVEYALKAASDGDFQKHELLLQQFLIKTNQELYADFLTEMTAYITKDDDYRQITGLESEIKVVTGNEILLDYQQARRRWRDLQQRISNHSYQRQKLETFISDARNKINSLKQIVETTGFGQTYTASGIEKLNTKLVAVIQLHLKNQFMAFETWDASMKELTEAIRKYANKLYNSAVTYYSVEISNNQKTIEKLNEEIAAKYNEYNRMYDNNRKY